MEKKNKSLVIWTIAALLVGIVIGLLITNVTTGNAIKSTSVQNIRDLDSGIAEMYATIDCHCEDGEIYTLEYDWGSGEGIYPFCGGYCKAKGSAVADAIIK